MHQMLRSQEQFGLRLSLRSEIDRSTVHIKGARHRRVADLAVQYIESFPQLGVICHGLLKPLVGNGKDIVRKIAQVDFHKGFVVHLIRPNQLPHLKGQLV